jgi:hypothetical protein
MGTPALDAVKRLIDRFDQDRKVFLSGDYKEEQLRAEFLNGPCPTIRHSDFVVRTSPSPFFTALGWDMDNKQGLSETFKQVIHEESIKTTRTIGLTTGRFCVSIHRVTEPSGRTLTNVPSDLASRFTPMELAHLTASREN